MTSDPHKPLPSSAAPPSDSGGAAYWRSNVRLMAVLLLVWASAGLGAGVLFADRLNAYTLPGTGFPLGFWFAHQGSIVAFVLLILAYCLLMNRLDERHRGKAGRTYDEESG